MDSHIPLKCPFFNRESKSSDFEFIFKYNIDPKTCFLTISYHRKESFETIENIIKLAKKDVKPGALLSLLSLRVNANRDRVIDIHKAVQVSHVYSLYFTKEFLNMDIKCANSVLKRMIVGTLEEKKRQIQQESGLLTRIYGYFSKKIKCDENEMILRKVENHGTLLKLQRDLAYEKKKAKEEEEWTERVIEGGSRKDSCVYIEDVQEEEEEREGGEEGSYEVRNCERECCTSKEPREGVTEEVTSKGEQHPQLSTRVGGKEDGNTGCQVEISIRKEPKDRKETTKVLEKDVNNLILNEDYQKEEIDPLKKEDKEENQTIQCEKSKVNQIEIETS